MSLLPISDGILEITLPEYCLTQKPVGGNVVKRYVSLECVVQVLLYESTSYEGWYKLKLQSPWFYNCIYLRKKGACKAPPATLYCLESLGKGNISKLDKTTKLKWIQHPCQDDSFTPDEVVKSWRGRFQFLEDNPDMGQMGLRRPQLGAIHAVSAYFSVKRSGEPATVVLPTGTGKTETMLALLIYRQISKLLVIVPSDALRDQITRKFYGLGCLSDLGIIPYETQRPFVTAVRKAIQNIEEVHALVESNNVIIATPKVLDASDSDSVKALCDGMSDLFIDEAHHISAKTWKRIRQHFIADSKSIVQFTATPFRNDGNSLGGRIIYNYTMEEAQESQYFKHIKLVSVEEYRADKADEAIAKKAIETLKSDIDNGYNHLLMARVGTKVRADAVYKLYKRLAPDLNPVVVYSASMSASDVKRNLDLLRSTHSKIVVCVNMLGEGVDIPRLKVAVIHDMHKTLAVTLQFIGRFTRQTGDIGDASVVVNIADPEVDGALHRLYSQGADWDNILRRLSSERIGREVRLQDVIEGLKEKGNLHSQLALWNLRPAFSSILFKADSDTWEPEKFKEVLPENATYWYACSQTEKILVVLALYQEPVQWGKYKDLYDNIYKLMILKKDDARSAVFVYSDDYKWFKVQDIVKLIVGENCEQISGPQIFNVFNGLEYPLVRNLGSAQAGMISFTQYFGSNVTAGLANIEKAESYLSNLAGVGYDNGERVIWGCSQKKGKIWSVTGGSISDWIDWVSRAWDKIATGGIDEENITKDFLRPEKIGTYYEKYACSIYWGEHIQNDKEDHVFIQIADTEIPLYLVDLKIIEQGDSHPYQIGVYGEGVTSVYSFSITPDGVKYDLISGDAVKVKRGRHEAIPLENYLQTDPWIIQYIDASFSYGNHLIKLPETVGIFDPAHIDCWDWTGIDIARESMDKQRSQNTVQWKAFKQMETSYDIIINDDGSGEAADLVALKMVGAEIHIGFVHCKYSGGSPGARVKDLYEVCGQSQKSIRWKHAGFQKLYEHLIHREQRWQTDGYSRFLKGTLAELSNIKNRSRTATVKLSIHLVQPGLKKSAVSPDMLRLLEVTSIYLKKAAQSELVIIGTE